MDSVSGTPSEIVISLLEELYVPEVHTGFDVPIERSHYSEYLPLCEPKFEKIIQIINANGANLCNTSQKLKKRILTRAIIINGEHSVDERWTSPSMINKALIILNKIFDLFGYCSTAIVLADNNGLILKEVLQTIRPRLLKDNWKKYPAAVTCYGWVLKIIQSPNLSLYLTNVVPTTLIVIDDFETENRKIGLEFLEHIITNVGISHLSWHGYDQVILKVLDHLFYVKEFQLIAPLTQTFVALLVKKYPSKFRAVLQVTEFDEMIDRFLSNMIMEEKLSFREAYMCALQKIIAARGLGMVIHATSLVAIISEYALEPSSSYEGLCVMKSYIEVCWPRIETNCLSFLTVLLKICIGSKTGRFSTASIDAALNLIRMLKVICPKKISLASKAIRSNHQHAILNLPGFQELVQESNPDILAP